MASTSHKNKLQEWVQKKSTDLALPMYHTFETIGGLFQCKVTVYGEQFQGKEKQKKIKAEQSAAKVALRSIERRLNARIVDEKDMMYNQPPNFNSVVFIDLDSFEKQQIDRFPDVCHRLVSFTHLIGFTSDESTKQQLSSVMEIQHIEAEQPGASQITLAFQIGRWCNALEILSTSLSHAASKQHFVFHILSSDMYTFQPVIESLQQQGCIAFHHSDPDGLLAFTK